MSNVLSANSSTQNPNYSLALERYRGAYESTAGHTSLNTSDFEQFVLQNTSAVYNGLRPAIQTSLHHAFTRLDRSQPESNVLLLSLPASPAGHLEEFDELVEDLCSFFAGRMDEEQIVDLNRQFWQQCDGVFRQTANMRVELYALQAAKMDTETIRQALNLTP